jgi:hypothetical protein
MKYQLHQRSQHAKTGRSGFSGPDTYIAVTICPEHAEVPAVLRADVLEKRAIGLKHFGEGYRKHSGPRSALGIAIAEAKAWIAEREAAQNTARWLEAEAQALQAAKVAPRRRRRFDFEVVAHA